MLQTVLAFLQSCVSIRTPVKATRKRSVVVDKDHIVAVCSAILLRGISQQMNQFQRVVSTILYCWFVRGRIKEKISTIYAIKYQVYCMENTVQWSANTVQLF